MRYRNFDLNLLVILDSLLAERQVGRAAERIRLSQPATSNALRRLRDQFDDELLVQVGRRFALTPLGERLQPRVRAILDEIGSLLGTDMVGALVPRTIRIMASDYVGTVLLPRVARALADAGLPASLSIVPLVADYQDKVALGEVDFLIVPEHLRIDEEPAETLFSDGYSCLAWRGNLAVQPTLGKDMFEAATHMVVVLGRGFRSNLDAVQLARAGLARHSCLSVPHFLMVPEYLVGTHMLATVHTRLAHHLARSNPLVVLKTPAELPRMTEVLQWTRHRQDDVLHVRLRKIIIEIAAGI